MNRFWRSTFFIMSVAWVVEVIAFGVMRAFDFMPASHLVRFLLSIPPFITLAVVFTCLTIALVVHLRIGFAKLYEDLGSPFSASREKTE